MVTRVIFKLERLVTIHNHGKAHFFLLYSTKKLIHTGFKRHNA